MAKGISEKIKERYKQAVAAHNKCFEINQFYQSRTHQYIDQFYGGNVFAGNLLLELKALRNEPEELSENIIQFINDNEAHFDIFMGYVLLVVSSAHISSSLGRLVQWYEKHR